MVLNGIVTAIATLGVGKIPKAPGTWGSLLSVLIWWALFSLFPDSFQFPETHFYMIIVAFFIGWLATHCYEKWNNRHDPKEVVVDELIGMWITLFAAPRILWVYALGFLFFRLFDIWKPFPIGWIDRKVPGALGTILDDVVAGLFAWILLWLVLKNTSLDPGFLRPEI